MVPDEDPEQQLRIALRELHLAAGEPTRDAIANHAAEDGKRSTLSNVLEWRNKPRISVVLGFVSACAEYAAQVRKKPLPEEMISRQRWMKLYDSASLPRRPVGRNQRGFDAGRREVVWPIRVGHVPLAVDCFQDRPVGVDLATAASQGGTVVVCQILSGLGGVGKTQLAAQYARGRREANDVDLLVWVNAASRVQIIDGYAEAAARIGLVSDDGGNADQATARLLDWLRNTDKSWLIVLDGLARPGDLNGCWPPDAASGTTVITTRRRDDALNRSGRAIIDVGLFTPDEARTYLEAKLATRATAGDGDPIDEIDGLAADLGWLPLALAQAATYMADRGLTCAAYRDRFADRKRTLAQLLPEDGSLPDEHAATVAVTWSLSIDAADALAPAGLARPLLQLASLLGQNDIPTTVFTTDETLDWLASRRTTLAADGDNAESVGATVTDADVNDGLHNLRRLNLLAFAGDTVRVHSLVQRATREAARRDLTRSGAWRHLILATADAVVAAGNLERDPARLRSLTEMLWPHAQALIDHGGAELWAPDGHTMLFGLGTSLGGFGHGQAAADYFRDLAQTAAEHLGPTHADTFLARAEHARWLGESGDPASAVAEFDRVIADRTSAYGEDDPDNLRDTANQAIYRRLAGDTKGSFDAYTQIAQRRAELHGPNDPQTLITRANQAGSRGEHGDIRGAIRAYIELVPLYEQQFGTYSPEMLHLRGELASWQGELDPAVGAAALASLLKIEEIGYGPTHPTTMATRRNLATLHGRAGQVDQAISELTDLITDYEQHINPDHPKALTARCELAELLILKRKDLRAAYRVLNEPLARQPRATAVVPATDRDRNKTTAVDPESAESTASTAMKIIEEKFERSLNDLLRSATDSTPHLTTLARLADDAQVDVGWLRQALHALVDTGTLRTVRRVPTGDDAADVLTIADHARFYIMQSQPT